MRNQYNIEDCGCDEKERFRVFDQGGNSICYAQNRDQAETVVRLLATQGTIANDAVLGADEPTETEATVACLRDDAAFLRQANPECEMAQNMIDAADLIETLDTALFCKPSQPSAQPSDTPAFEQKSAFVKVADRCLCDAYSAGSSSIEFDLLAAKNKLLAALPAAPQVAQPSAESIHHDDTCVDAFAQTMKAKLAKARSKGRGGWMDCSADELSRMLRDHVEKGDPVDVANFCMFIDGLGYSIKATPPTVDQDGVKDAEISRLSAIINTPQSGDFLRAVSIEAEHQRQRWGADGDAGKAASDWFWLIGYLAGKALHAHAAGDMIKAEHHIITTAAACQNWHAAMFGNTEMRPGIAASKSGDQDRVKP